MNVIIIFAIYYFNNTCIYLNHLSNYNEPITSLLIHEMAAQSNI